MPTLSGIRDINAIDRPGQAMQSLLTGDMDAAWRSMLSPQSLTLEERNALLGEMGLTDQSLQGRILKAVTNPGVLISLLLTMQFPVPTARNMFKAAAGIEGMMAKIPIMRQFASPRTMFAGTEVPGILDNIIRHKNEIYETYMAGRLGPAFQRFESQTGRAINAREQAMVFLWAENLHKKTLPGFKDVGVLVPNLERHMSRPMLELGREVRDTLNHTLDNVWANPENQAGLRNALAQMEKMGYADDEMKQIASLLDGDGYKGIPDYMPHRVVRTEGDIKRLRDAVQATASDKDFQRSAQYKMLTFMGREFYKRDGAMMPALQELMAIGDIVDKGAYLKLQNSIKDRVIDGLKKSGLSDKTVNRLATRSLDEITNKGQTLVQPGELDRFVQSVAETMPAQYSIKLEPVLQQYYHSVAGTYAFTIKGEGPRLMGQVNIAKTLAPADSRAAYRAHVLENTVIPNAAGRPSPRQAINAGLWDQRMGAIAAHLDRPAVQALIGPKFAGTLKEAMTGAHGSFSLRRLFQGTASYFYLSTLGLNPASAFRNQFQSIITTGPLVGMGNALAGQAEAWSRSGKYFEARIAGKLDHASAMAKAFPDFVKAGLNDSPISGEALGRAFDSAYRIHKTAPIGTASVSQQVQRAMMAMFSASETSVRLGAFYAGLRHGAADGLKGASLLEHARRVTVKTQFVPSLTDQGIIFGPTGALSNPILRQFMQFPSRTLEFTIEGIQEAMRGNPARIVRQLGGAYVTSEIADVLGLNVTDALLGAALPEFTNVDEKGNILAPLPVVPPAVALTASVASGISSGDWQSFHRHLPSLVPGGVGLARAVGFLPGPAEIPQAAARWLDRKYAAYEEPTQSGRVPVYTGSGGLLGYYQPWEIVKHALGINGSDLEQESQLAHTLTKERDAIKETRKRYFDALFANDSRQAAGIEVEYLKRFGHKMEVSEQDIKAVQEQRKLTRIERLLATMPKAARGHYEQRIQTQLGPTEYGAQLPNRAGKSVPSYTNDLGTLDQVDPYSIGRYRRIPETFP